MGCQVTEEGLGTKRDSATRPWGIFPPSSSGDVTFDISPRTTGNEVVKNY